MDTWDLSNHTNTEKANPDTIPSGLYLLEPSEDPTELWNKKVIYEESVSDAAATQAAPGIFSWGILMEILIWIFSFREMEIHAYFYLKKMAKNTPNT